MTYYQCPELKKEIDLEKQKIYELEQRLIKLKAYLEGLLFASQKLAENCDKP